MFISSYLSTHTHRHSISISIYIHYYFHFHIDLCFHIYFFMLIFSTFHHHLNTLIVYANVHLLIIYHNFDGNNLLNLICLICMLLNQNNLLLSIRGICHSKILIVLGLLRNMRESSIINFFICKVNRFKNISLM